MTGRLKRFLSMVLIAAMTLSCAPAFAKTKAAKLDLSAISCAKDYGFSYSSRKFAKGAAADFLDLIGGKIADNILDRSVDWAVSEFLDAIFGSEQGKVDQQLREINGKLDEIKSLLDEMYQKLTAMDFRSTMQARDQKYNEFKPEVVSRVNRLMQATTADARKKVVTDWADKSMMSSSSGVTATTQWGQLISTPIGGYTYIQCYDGYAKAAFPWEHDGYDFREATRTADLALYLNACILTSLYYNMVIAGEIPGKSAQSEKDNIADFKKQLASVLAYFEKPENTVARNNRENRCQITGMTDFVVYVEKAERAEVWNGARKGADVFDLLKQIFYRDMPLKSGRLEKLMAFYPNTSVHDILTDKIGVKGITDDSYILIDMDYRIDYSGIRLARSLLVKSIHNTDKKFSDVGNHSIGVYEMDGILITGFRQWISRVSNDFLIVRTNDQFGNELLSGEKGNCSGTITEVSPGTSLTLTTAKDNQITFDITNAQIDGNPEPGLEASVSYHEEGGVRVAEVVTIHVPLELMEPPITVSGTVLKQERDTLTIAGEDDKTYEFIIGANVDHLAAIGEGTRITVTYQQGSDGNLYVVDLDDLDYEKPVFPFVSLTLEKGKTKKLKNLTEVPGAWSVEDESVAKIVKGKTLKAVGVGSTNLMFTVGGPVKNVVNKGATVSPGDVIVVPLTVEAKGTQVKSVAIKPKKPKKIGVGATLQLKASWKPKTAVETAIAWSSADEGVATVDESGLVTAVAAGKTKITATAPNGVSKSVTVTVK